MSIATPSEITEARANSSKLRFFEFPCFSDVYKRQKENNNHIVREFDLRVISTDKAEAELNAK